MKGNGFQKTRIRSFLAVSGQTASLALLTHQCLASYVDAGILRVDVNTKTLYKYVEGDLSLSSYVVGQCFQLCLLFPSFDEVDRAACVYPACPGP